MALFIIDNLRILIMGQNRRSTFAGRDVLDDD